MTTALTTRDRRGLVLKSSIQQLADEIVRKFHPRKIILFGSYVGGEATPDSDVDLLVVLQPGRRGVTSLRIRRAIDYRFALDLIVLTAGKFCERLKESDFFLLDIVEQGIVLYEEDNG